MANKNRFSILIGLEIDFFFILGNYNIKTGLKRPLSKIWLCFFIVTLGFGAYLYFTKGISVNPWKELQEQPLEHTTSRFEKKLTQQLSEQRHPLLTSLSFLKLEILGGSITPKVDIGKKGWLFLKQEEPDRNTIEQSLGIQQYSPLELKQWTLLFQQRRSWAEKRSIGYVLVFAPNKASVYPEFLRSHYKNKKQVSSTEHLKAQLDSIYLIDLGEHLRQNKNQGRLFQRTDTHWNDFGAFLAYQYLIQSLPEPYRDIPLSLANCQQTVVEKPAGDLARLLLMNQKWVESNPQINLLEPTSSLLDEKSKPVSANLRPLVYSNSNAILPKVFFDHDSYGKYLVPFLAEHFSESVFLWGWQGFHTDLIKRENPALIVDQWVERALVGALPRNDWEVIQEYWGKHFNNLPDEKLSKMLPLSEIISWVYNLNMSSNKLAIAKIHIKPQALDKLIVDYENERGYYWLPPEGQTYYLELNGSNLSGLEAEKEKTLYGSVKIRFY